jgi:hypothetical protein
MSVEATTWAKGLLTGQVIYPVPGNVLLAVARSADSDGRAQITVADIHADTQLSVSEIEASLAWLETHHLLHREPRQRNNPDTLTGLEVLPDVIWLRVGGFPTDPLGSWLGAS